MTSTELDTGTEQPPLDHIDVDGADKPLNPVEVEAGIRKVSRLVYLGARYVTEREDTFREKARDCDKAFARAYLRHDGPAHEKRYVAELDPEVVRAREVRDDAELAFKYAERRQKALIEALGSIRSIGASVREMYRAETGVGR